MMHNKKNESLTYLEIALELAQANENLIALEQFGGLHFAIGMIYFSLYKYKTCIEHLQKSNKFLRSHPLSVCNNTIIELAESISKGNLFFPNIMETMHRIVIQVLGKNNHILAKTFMGQGLHYRDTDIKKSTDFFEKALENSIKFNGKQNLSSVELLICLGENKSFEGDFDKALIYYEESLTALTNSEDCKPEFLAVVYKKLGNLARKTGNFNDAIKNYKLALEIIAQTSNSNRLEIFRYQTMIGRLHAHLKNFDESLVYLMNALETFKKGSFRDPVSVVSIYRMIGDIYLLSNNHTKALPYLEDGYKFGLEQLGKHNRIILDLSNTIKLIREKYIYPHLERKLQRKIENHKRSPKVNFCIHANLKQPKIILLENIFKLILE